MTVIMTSRCITSGSLLCEQFTQSAFYIKLNVHGFVDHLFYFKVVERQSVTVCIYPSVFSCFLRSLLYGKHDVVGSSDCLVCPQPVVCLCVPPLSPAPQVFYFRPCCNHSKPNPSRPPCELRGTLL